MKKQDEELTLKDFEELHKPLLFPLLQGTFYAIIFGLAFAMSIVNGEQVILWGVVTIPIISYTLWTWYAYFRDLLSYKKKAKESYEESLKPNDTEMTEEENEKFLKKVYWYMIKLPKGVLYTHILAYIIGFVIDIYKGKMWIEVLKEARLIGIIISAVVWVIVLKQLKKTYSEIENKFQIKEDDK